MTLSVIIPSFRGQDWILECLDACASQTLASSSYELVVVVNGDPGRTPELIEGWARSHPETNLVLRVTEAAGVTYARDHGMEHATGDWVTFVDDDDRIEPGYLAALMSVASTQAIGIAPGALVMDDAWESPDWSFDMAQGPLTWAGKTGSIKDFGHLLRPAWGKVVAMSQARSIGFDDRLARYGDDTVFWLKVAERFGLELRVAVAGQGDAYLYRVRSDSISGHGQTSTWDRHVDAALAVVRAFESIGGQTREFDREMRDLAHRLLVGPIERMRRFAVEHPEEASRLVACLEDFAVAHQATRVALEQFAAEIGGSPRVSVVIPSFDGSSRIATALDSIAQQSLKATEFEVVVVLNGRGAHRTEKVIRAWRLSNRDVKVVILRSESGVSRARNAGLDAAQGAFVVFVDDDDSIGPRHLEALLTTSLQSYHHASIPHTNVIELVGENAVVEHRTQYTDAWQALLAGSRARSHVARLSSTVWGKMLRTPWARAVRFDPDLTLGEDGEFMCRYLGYAYKEYEGLSYVAASDAAASYRRLVRKGSAMQFGTTVAWGTVQARLQTIAALERSAVRLDRTGWVAQWQINAMWRAFIQPYALRGPTERAALVAEVGSIGLSSSYRSDLRPDRDTAYSAALQEAPDGITAVLESIAADGSGRLDPRWEQIVRPLMCNDGQVAIEVHHEILGARLEAPWMLESDEGTSADPCVHGISVVVPCYRAAATIKRCLDSLAAQTSSTHLFEVVLVHNGPDDGSSEVVAQWRRDNPAVIVSEWSSEVASAAAARNVGIQAASMPYVTFVDADDWVRPEFVRALLSRVGPGVLAIVPYEDRRAGSSELATDALWVAGLDADFDELAAHLRPVCAKAVATAVARQVGFDETLWAAEDTLFWIGVVTAGALRPGVARGGCDAAYVYVHRDDGVTASADLKTFDERLAGALALMSRLARLPMSHRLADVVEGQKAGILDWFVGSALRQDSGRWGEMVDQVGPELVSNAVLTSLQLLVTDTVVIIEDQQSYEKWRQESGRDSSILVCVGPRDWVPERGSTVASFVGQGRRWSDLAAVVSHLKRLVARHARIETIVSVGFTGRSHVVAGGVHAAAGRPLAWRALGASRRTVGPIERDALAALIERASGGLIPDSAGMAEAAAVALSMADEVCFEPSAAEMPPITPNVSLVIPVRSTDGRVLTMLGDLAAQECHLDGVEVVVVVNGPRGSVPDLITHWSREHPSLIVRVIETVQPGAAHARNIGIEAARKPWVGFIDDDDRLDPGWLSALWRAAVPGHIVCGSIHVATSDLSRRDEHSWLMEPLRASRTRGGGNAARWSAIHPSWGKIAQLSVIGQVRFAEHLSYGEDTAFWLEVLMRSGAELKLTDLEPGSAYVWVQREGSLTNRTVSSFERAVEWPMAVLTEIERIVGSAVYLDVLLVERVKQFFTAQIERYRAMEPDHLSRVQEVKRRSVQVPIEVSLPSPRRSGTRNSEVVVAAIALDVLRRRHETLEWWRRGVVGRIATLRVIVPLDDVDSAVDWILEAMATSGVRAEGDLDIEVVVAATPSDAAREVAVRAQFVICGEHIEGLDVPSAWSEAEVASLIGRPTLVTAPEIHAGDEFAVQGHGPAY